MSTDDEESNLTIHDIFIDDDLSDNISLSGITSFREENYHLSHLTLEPQTSTPINSFTTSPKSTTEVGTVKRLAAIYESTNTNSSNVADRTRAKMGSKIPRFQKVFEMFEVEVNKLLIDMDRALGTDDTEKMEDLENELQAYKITLQADIEKIASETCEKSDVDEIASLEHKAKILLIKITKAIGKANKKTSKTKTKQSPVSAGKIEKLDIPEFDGDCTKFKFFRTRFNVLTEVFDEVSTKIYLRET